MSVPPARSTRKGSPPRSDAQRNRERIVHVAGVEFQADPDVSLRTIAKKAGVGQGTLYRNFPNREALLWAVHNQEVERLAATAAELLERLGPVAALREWLRRWGGFAIANSHLDLAMNRTIPPTAGPVSDGHTFCADSLSLLLEANQRARTVRSDITRDDLQLALAGIWKVSDPDPVIRKIRAERVIDIVLTGISEADGRV